MANDIQLKRSSVPGKVPDAGNVLVGEPVLNLADRIIYTKNGSGNIIVIGANLTLQSVDTSNTVISSVGDVRTIQFDQDSGFDVIDRANGIAKIQMNSTFKTWNVSGQANLVAQGLDVVEFVAGDNIVITTDANANPQQIIFGVDGVVTAVNNQIGNVSLSTDQIPEENSAVNLYFTNARSIAALTAGENIVIDANGRITSSATIDVTACATITINQVNTSNTTLNTYANISVLEFDRDSGLNVQQRPGGAAKIISTPITDFGTFTSPASVIFRLRRGLEQDRTSFIPLEGELIYTTDTKFVYVGDGFTYGGILVSGLGVNNTLDGGLASTSIFEDIIDGGEPGSTYDTNVDSGTLI